MRKSLRFVLLSWGIFDVLTAATAIFAPALFTASLWPSASGDVHQLVRRTAAWWLVMGVAQLAAFANPKPERLKLVALLRLVDGLADVLWLLSSPGFSSQGWITIGISPPLCLLVAWLAWSQAHRPTETAIAS
jgi:hypothetical protein